MRVNVVVARVAVGLQERKGVRIGITIAIKVRDHDHDQGEDLFLQCIRKKISPFWPLFWTNAQMCQYMTTQVLLDNLLEATTS